MTKITAAISAVGKYVPEYVLTNKELETYIESIDKPVLPYQQMEDMEREYLDFYKTKVLQE